MAGTCRRIGSTMEPGKEGLHVVRPDDLVLKVVVLEVRGLVVLVEQEMPDVVEQGRGHHLRGGAFPARQAGALQGVLELGDAAVVVDPPLLLHVGEEQVGLPRRRGGRPQAGAQRSIDASLVVHSTVLPRKCLILLIRPGFFGILPHLVHGGELVLVVALPQVPRRQGVVGDVEQPARLAGVVRRAVVGGVRAEEQDVPRIGRDRHPFHPRRRRLLDAAVLVEGDEAAAVQPRAEEQAAVLRGRRVDRNQAGDVVVDELVGRGVLVGGVPAPAGILVVDLLLVEDGLLPHQP